MIKRTIPLLLMLMLLLGLAHAQQTIQTITPTPGPGETAAPTSTAAPALSPTPAPEPRGTSCSAGKLSLLLPESLAPLTEDELALYDAALQSDYEDTAELLLAASEPESGCAVLVAMLQSAASAKIAAPEAAGRLLGDQALATAIRYGENEYTAFACAIAEHVYNLYFLSLEDELYIIGTSGLSEEQNELLLSSVGITEI